VHEHYRGTISRGDKEAILMMLRSHGGRMSRVSVRHPLLVRFHDVRQEPVGDFAGPVEPDSPVGTFGNRRVRRRQGNGTFTGDADRQRQGSYGDLEIGDGGGAAA
jgi:hypothetical protein